MEGDVAIAFYSFFSLLKYKIIILVSLLCDKIFHMSAVRWKSSPKSLGPSGVTSLVSVKVLASAFYCIFTYWSIPLCSTENIEY